MLINQLFCKSKVLWAMNVKIMVCDASCMQENEKNIAHEMSEYTTVDKKSVIRKYTTVCAKHVM